MSFQINSQSVFDEPADAFVNTINCVGAMGAGIALEFKKRYPAMFADYQIQCKKKLIRPGDCYGYFDKDHEVYLLGLAVKNDWHYWSTLEWLESSLKSLKLFILENDIKSLNMPLPGGMNGRRGPYGKVAGLTPPPSNREDLKFMVRRDLEKFSEKFGVDIKLCIPDEAPKKSQLDLSSFIEYDKVAKETI